MQDNEKPMPDDHNPLSKQAELTLSIRKNATILGLFGLFCTLVIGLTFSGTEERIADQKRRAKLNALYQITPVSSHNNDLLQDTLDQQFKELGHRSTKVLHFAKRDDVVRTIIYPVTTSEGYSGDIDFLLGVNMDGSVAGLRVVQHKETPGLGDGIELRKSSWVLDFDDKSLDNPNDEGWQVKKDGGVFDGFTGATITPRAIVLATAKTLAFHRDNAEQLIKMLEDVKRQSKDKTALSPTTRQQE